jgi:Xaa-Pro dipeptidase
MLQCARPEFEARIASARRAISERGHYAMLLFAPESHYYLTGFDTAGYVLFQCVLLTSGKRRPVLLKRLPDLEQARITSIIEGVHIWYDREGAIPAWSSTRSPLCSAFRPTDTPSSCSTTSSAPITRRHWAR